MAETIDFKRSIAEERPNEPALKCSFEPESRKLLVRCIPDNGSPDFGSWYLQLYSCVSYPSWCSGIPFYGAIAGEIVSGSKCKSHVGSQSRADWAGRSLVHGFVLHQ